MVGSQCPNNIEKAMICFEQSSNFGVSQMHAENAHS